MQVEQKSDVVRRIVRESRMSGRTVGFVPTMGALHDGHVSLMEAAVNNGDFCVASIFVNPTQFGPNEDFSRYPRTLEDDLQRCREAGVDLVFVPETSEMYLPDAQTEVRVTSLTTVLEGAIRPGHFSGVTTVVAKLFHIAEPDRAYFGQKDFQQQLVIRQMVRDLSWGLEIVTCPIVRDPDGLAMSSRNRYLTAAERNAALVLSRSLKVAVELSEQETTTAEQVAERVSLLIGAEPDVVPDYAVVVDPETLHTASGRPAEAVVLVAARLGKTRLIDNQILRFR
ncbi:MAG: pantoate--beta-alanine ligase [Planctomycetaceae bacterium]|nr:pantoate--beta-alanine ligase [Planctomycetaceae bacterium]